MEPDEICPCCETIRELDQNTGKFICPICTLAAEAAETCEEIKVNMVPCQICLPEVTENRQRLDHLMAHINQIVRATREYQKNKIVYENMTNMFSYTTITEKNELVPYCLQCNCTHDKLTGRIPAESKDIICPPFGHQTTVCNCSEPDKPKRLPCNTSHQTGQEPCPCDDELAKKPEECPCDEPQPREAEECPCDEPPPKDFEECPCDEPKPKAADECPCDEPQPKLPDECPCEPPTVKEPEECPCDEPKPKQEECVCEPSQSSKPVSYAQRSVPTDCSCPPSHSAAAVEHYNNLPKPYGMPAVSSTLALCPTDMANKITKASQPYIGKPCGPKICSKGSCYPICQGDVSEKIAKASAPYLRFASCKQYTCNEPNCHQPFSQDSTTYFAPYSQVNTPFKPAKPSQSGKDTCNKFDSTTGQDCCPNCSTKMVAGAAPSAPLSTKSSKHSCHAPKTGQSPYAKDSSTYYTAISQWLYSTLSTQFESRAEPYTREGKPGPCGPRTMKDEVKVVKKVEPPPKYTKPYTREGKPGPCGVGAGVSLVTTVDQTPSSYAAYTRDGNIGPCGSCTSKKVVDQIPSSYSSAAREDRQGPCCSAKDSAKLSEKPCPTLTLEEKPEACRITDACSCGYPICLDEMSDKIKKASAPYFRSISSRQCTSKSNYSTHSQCYMFTTEYPKKGKSKVNANMRDVATFVTTVPQRQTPFARKEKKAPCCLDATNDSSTPHYSTNYTGEDRPCCINAIEDHNSPNRTIVPYTREGKPGPCGIFGTTDTVAPIKTHLLPYTREGRPGPCGIYGITEASDPSKMQIQPYTREGKPGPCGIFGNAADSVNVQLMPYTRESRPGPCGLLEPVNTFDSTNSQLLPYTRQGRPGPCGITDSAESTNGQPKPYTREGVAGQCGIFGRVDTTYRVTTNSSPFTREETSGPSYKIDNTPNSTLSSISLCSREGSTESCGIFGRIDTTYRMNTHSRPYTREGLPGPCGVSEASTRNPSNQPSMAPYTREGRPGPCGVSEATSGVSTGLKAGTPVNKIIAGLPGVSSKLSILSKVRNNIGYKETEFKEITKISRYKNPDGTIVDEKQIITIKTVKKSHVSTTETSLLDVGTCISYSQEYDIKSPYKVDKKRSFECKHSYRDTKSDVAKCDNASMASNKLKRSASAEGSEAPTEVNILFGAWEVGPELEITLGGTMCDILDDISTNPKATARSPVNTGFNPKCNCPPDTRPIPTNTFLDKDIKESNKYTFSSALPSNTTSSVCANDNRRDDDSGAKCGCLKPPVGVTIDQICPNKLEDTECCPDCICADALPANDDICPNKIEDNECCPDCVCAENSPAKGSEICPNQPEDTECCPDCVCTNVPGGDSGQKCNCAKESGAECRCAKLPAGITADQICPNKLGDDDCCPDCDCADGSPDNQKDPSCLTSASVCSNRLEDSDEGPKCSCGNQTSTAQSGNDRMCKCPDKSTQKSVGPVYSANDADSRPLCKCGDRPSKVSGAVPSVAPDHNRPCICHKKASQISTGRDKLMKKDSLCKCANAKSNVYGSNKKCTERDGIKCACLVGSLCLSHPVCEEGRKAKGSNMCCTEQSHKVSGRDSKCKKDDDCTKCTCIAGSLCLTHSVCEDGSKTHGLKDCCADHKQQIISGRDSKCKAKDDCTKCACLQGSLCLTHPVCEDGQRAKKNDPLCCTHHSHHRVSGRDSKCKKDDDCTKCTCLQGSLCLTHPVCEDGRKARRNDPTCCTDQPHHSVSGRDSKCKKDDDCTKCTCLQGSLCLTHPVCEDGQKAKKIAPICYTDHSHHKISGRDSKCKANDDCTKCTCIEGSLCLTHSVCEDGLKDQTRRQKPCCTDHAHHSHSGRDLKCKEKDDCMKCACLQGSQCLTHPVCSEGQKAKKVSPKCCADHSHYIISGSGHGRLCKPTDHCTKCSCIEGSLCLTHSVCESQRSSGPKGDFGTSTTNLCSTDVAPCDGRVGNTASDFKCDCTSNHYRPKSTPLAISEKAWATCKPRQDIVAKLSGSKHKKECKQCGPPKEIVPDCKQICGGVISCLKPSVTHTVCSYTNSTFLNSAEQSCYEYQEKCHDDTGNTCISTHSSVMDNTARTDTNHTAIRFHDICSSTSELTPCVFNPINSTPICLWKDWSNVDDKDSKGQCTVKLTRKPAKTRCCQKNEEGIFFKGSFLESLRKILLLAKSPKPKPDVNKVCRSCYSPLSTSFQVKIYPPPCTSCKGNQPDSDEEYHSATPSCKSVGVDFGHHSQTCCFTPTNTKPSCNIAIPLKRTSESCPRYQNSEVRCLIRNQSMPNCTQRYTCSSDGNRNDFGPIKKGKIVHVCTNIRSEDHICHSDSCIGSRDSQCSMKKTHSHPEDFYRS